MKRILLLMTCLVSLTMSFAQPAWVKKASRSVFTLKTFAADGSLIASTNGFFTGSNGEAISNFTPFKGASRAVIIDAQGKEMEPMICMMSSSSGLMVKHNHLSSVRQ